jgi:hypothetical protein
MTGGGACYRLGLVLIFPKLPSILCIQAQGNFLITLARKNV